jgi:hypothetical protein
VFFGLKYIPYKIRLLQVGREWASGEWRGIIYLGVWWHVELVILTGHSTGHFTALLRITAKFPPLRSGAR